MLQQRDPRGQTQYPPNENMLLSHLWSRCGRVMAGSASFGIPSSRSPSASPCMAWRPFLMKFGVIYLLIVFDCDYAIDGAAAITGPLVVG